MKRQYFYYKTTSFRCRVELYHDGKRFGILNIWETELQDEIARLEEQGYTYGYTIDEAEDARLRYEHILDNLILTEKTTEETK